MRSFQSPAPLGAASSSVALSALLILCVPACNSAPAELQRATTDQRLLSQIDAVCSSYSSTHMKFWAPDVLEELCVSLLLQKSKLLKLQNIKRAELQGPGGMQSRGYFLYRPRNGRRSLEYD
ncbi:neuromedin-U [Clinocottus analis]|uniref:neuromedin-U n=1 Tax=Clinocottus analis TaxID=304258 RepID=UPI0035C19BF9